MIKGDDAVIAASKKALPGDPSNMVNWDALNDLPDLYDGQVSQVRFKPPVGNDDGDFSPVGGEMFMPSTDLMNRIADARGISGLEMAVPEPILTEIDWNRMSCDFQSPPRMVRYLVGYTITKQGKVLTEDGTDRISDPCSVSYNAWERVCELFGKEEQYTDNYAKCERAANGSLWYAGYQGKQTFCKYDTRAKRQAAFDAELKFAERKADSKARNVVIRVLCGMKTGYTRQELACGYFTFYKIIRSSWAIKSEHAARLNSLSHGLGDNTASRALFGPSDDPVVKQAEPYTEPEQIEPVQSQRVVNREYVIRALAQYKKAGLISDTLIPTCDSLTAWLANTPDAETQTDYWNKTVAMLNGIEEKIPEGLRCQ